MIIEKELNEIKARCDKATAGPWVGDEKFGDVVSDVGKTGIAETCLRADTVFIAHTRSDVPALVAEVERFRKELADLCQRCGWRPKDEDGDDDGQGAQWESEIWRILGSSEQ